MVRFESLQSASRRSFEYSERHLTAIAIVSLTTIPLAGFIEAAVAQPSINAFPLRILSGLAGGALLLNRRFIHGFHYYWTIAITFILPFGFGLLLTLNAAYTPIGSDPSSVWVYQYLVALFFFINLIHHVPLSIVLWVFASTAVAASLLLVSDPNWVALRKAIVLPLPVYLTAVFVGGLMNRNVAMVQTEKLRAASAIGANLAHELRTPLASIGALAKGVDSCLPTLTDAYQKARDAHIPILPLRKSQLRQLNTVLTSIRKEVDYSNTIIDMLLVNTANKSLRGIETEAFSAHSAVDEAISRYPFNNQKERQLISKDGSLDFHITGPRLLIVHILFNLIKNALYFVQKSGNGDIRISTRLVGNRGKIIVHDTGTGIPASILPHIFERFYTTTHTGQGAGIGLSFCQLVMESIGGRIDCESVEGEYTTFTLTFPNVRA